MKVFSTKVNARKVGLLAGLMSLLALLPLRAMAHDGSWIGSIPGVGRNYEVLLEHQDDEPWKGWVYLMVTNTGNEPWGDFHFRIFQVGNWDGYVFFDVDPPNEPWSSQSGLTWVLGSNGQTLDLLFYGDPVLPGQTAQFKVYTDNTSNQLSFFGIGFYPTPVPIPGAVWLLGSGLVALGVLRRVRG